MKTTSLDKLSDSLHDVADNAKGAAREKLDEALEVAQAWQGCMSKRIQDRPLVAVAVAVVAGAVLSKILFRP